MRSLWIMRINAAARENGLPYNRFISGLQALGVTVDRKMLAELAVNDPHAFASLVAQIKGEAAPEYVAPAPPAPKPSSRPNGATEATSTAATTTAAPAAATTTFTPAAATTTFTPAATTVSEETQPLAAAAPAEVTEAPAGAEDAAEVAADEQ